MGSTASLPRMSAGTRTWTGPGLPVVAMRKARRMTWGTSSGWVRVKVAFVMPENRAVWLRPVSMFRLSMWRGMSDVKAMTGLAPFRDSAMPGMMWVLPTLGLSQTPGFPATLA